MLLRPQSRAGQVLSSWWSRRSSLSSSKKERTSSPQTIARQIFTCFCRIFLQNFIKSTTLFCPSCYTEFLGVDDSMIPSTFASVVTSKIKVGPRPDPMVRGSMLWSRPWYSEKMCPAGPQSLTSPAYTSSIWGGTLYGGQGSLSLSTIWMCVLLLVL